MEGRGQYTAEECAFTRRRTVVTAMLETAVTARAVGGIAAAGAAVPVKGECSAGGPHLPTNMDAGSTVWWGRLWSRLGLQGQGGG